LKERLLTVDQKGEMKKSDAIGAVDTNEKIKKAVELTYVDREKLEADNKAEW